MVGKALSSSIRPFRRWPILANNATFNLQLAPDGIWLAEDPDVQCFAEGADPSEAITALLDVEHQYLATLDGARLTTAAAANHREILRSRLVLRPE